tara:strand:- start:777 stop:1007 length:231 start_codon:yes stop_codon:yes gene_type:complete
VYLPRNWGIRFFISDIGVLSTLEQFRNLDISSMAGNEEARNLKGYNHDVPTILLDEVSVKNFEGAPIEYIYFDPEV